MATLDDIATNEHMLDIANAIRKATRSQAPMTIPEMPERLLDIRVLETTDKEITLNSETINLGEYDTTYKHLFIVTPISNTDCELLVEAEPELELVYTDGELTMSISNTTGEEIRIKILDFLIPDDEETAGFLVNISKGGSGGVTLEAYDSTRAYKVGETFLYTDSIGLTSIGVTKVAHEAEAYQHLHNILIADKIWDAGEGRYIGIGELENLIYGKLDKTAVKDQYTEEIDEVYSTTYINRTFATKDEALVKPTTTPTEIVLTYIDEQNEQHFIALDTNTIAIENNKLTSGLELEEVL